MFGKKLFNVELCFQLNSFVIRMLIIVQIKGGGINSQPVDLNIEVFIFYNHFSVTFEGVFGGIILCACACLF